MTKVCKICKQAKSLEDFNYQKDTRDKKRIYCKICSNNVRKKWMKENPNKGKTYSKKFRTVNKLKAIHNGLKCHYGITIEDYNKMLEIQNNKCKICNEHKDSFKNLLSVDHCHKTGKVRGLLCHRCNSGLGFFKDSKVLLQVAKEYLLESEN